MSGEIASCDFFLFYFIFMFVYFSEILIMDEFEDTDFLLFLPILLLNFCIGHNYFGSFCLLLARWFLKNITLITNSLGPD